MVRGSEKLLATWKARALTQDSVGEIAEALDKSAATVDDVRLHGGAEPTSVSVSMRYADEDVPSCGNDILFWWRWHIHNGGSPRPPKILWNGTPFPEELFIDLNFGTSPEVPVEGPAFGGAVRNELGG